MAEIALLSQETIDKIAAGEVIERPSSVVKELVENSIDSGATAITVEIKEGGVSFIRITDNGCGIDKKQVPLAFLRHSTSKIKSVEDLLSVSSLGFRGEALSSIAAVSQVELITKTISQMTGVRYVIEGSKEISVEEIGAPDGTTFLVRNLFYNTPARRKFLKSAQTEAGYINTLVERLALSHPEISFKFINNNQTKLHTSGNSNSKDVIYQIFGRDITASLLEINEKNDLFEVKGFIGKPVVSRGNRNFENYFINQRYIKSSLIAKGIEDAYKNFLMQHQYPFCVLYFTFAGEMLDVNVHPTKMELRFSQNEGIYQALYDCIRNRLVHREYINNVELEKKEESKSVLPKKVQIPEPFERRRMERQMTEHVTPPVAKLPDIQPESRPIKVRQPERSSIENNQIEKIAAAVRKDSPYEKKYERVLEQRKIVPEMPQVAEPVEQKKTVEPDYKTADYVQEELSYNGTFLSEQSKKLHKIIGQVFDTYWLVEFDGKLFIIDQHAAHEKVLYEKTVKSLQNKEFTTQMISPPVIVTLDSQEEQALTEFKEQLETLGFEIEPFGGKEYSICGIPDNLFGLNAKDILLEILDSSDEIHKASTPELVLEKIASMSCKAAVKGNDVLRVQEAEELITELLELENPYFCPHGRPTIISMTKYELEKKFKRIV